MTNLVLEDIKKDYQNGFRCIHAERIHDSYKIQLKNFHTEEIKMLSTNNLYEISRIEKYLECLDNIKEEKGYDF